MKLRSVILMFVAVVCGILECQAQRFEEYLYSSQKYRRMEMGLTV